MGVLAFCLRPFFVCQLNGAFYTILQKFDIYLVTKESDMLLINPTTERRLRFLNCHLLCAFIIILFFLGTISTVKAQNTDKFDFSFTTSTGGGVLISWDVFNCKVCSSDDYCNSEFENSNDLDSNLLVNSLQTPKIKAENGFTYTLALAGMGSQVTGNAYQSTFQGGLSDMILSKIDENGQVVYSTYLGGSGSDIPGDLFIENGYVYIVGFTNSTDFPVTANAAQSQHQGKFDLTLTKFSPNGTLLYSTYLGDADVDAFPILTVENEHVYIAALSSPRDSFYSDYSFGTTNIKHYENLSSLKVYSVANDGSLSYSKKLGKISAKDFDLMLYIANLFTYSINYHYHYKLPYYLSVSNGNLIVASYTYSEDYPISPNALQLVNSGFSDVVISSIKPNGEFNFSTFLGGNRFESITSMKVFGEKVYVVGYTSSSNFPTTNNAYLNEDGGGNFISIFNSNGDLEYSTLFKTNDKIVAEIWINDEGYKMAFSEFYSYFFYDKKIILFEFDHNNNFLNAQKDLKSISNIDLIFSLEDALEEDNGSYFDIIINISPFFYYYNLHLVNDELYSVQDVYYTENIITPSTTFESFYEERACNRIVEILKFNSKGDVCASEYIGDFDMYSDVYSDGKDIYILIEGYKVVKLKHIFEFDTTNVITPEYQEFCLNGPIQPLEGNLIEPGYCDPIYYQWEEAMLDSSQSPIWTPIKGQVVKDFSPSIQPIDKMYRRIIYYYKDGDTSKPKTISISNTSIVKGSIFNSPTVDAGNPLFTCKGTAVQLGGNPTVQGGLPPYKIDWDFEQFLNDKTVTNPIATVNQNTVFTVWVTDSNDCKNLHQVVVEISEATAKTQGSNVSVCSGNPVKIGTPLKPNETASFSWMPSTGLSCTDCPTPNAKPPVDQWYVLTKILTYQDGNSCVTKDSVIVRVVEKPTQKLEDKIICNSSENKFSIGYNSEPGFSYMWAPGKNLESTNSSRVTFNSNKNLPSPNPTKYILTASKNGCLFNDTMEVLILKADAGPDNCKVETIGVNRHPLIHASYQWTSIEGENNLLEPTNKPIVKLKKGESQATSIYMQEVCYKGVCCVDSVEIYPDCGGNQLLSVYNASGECKVNTGEGIALTANYSSTNPQINNNLITYSWTPCEGLDKCFGNKVKVIDFETRTYSVKAHYLGNELASKTIDVYSPQDGLTQVEGKEYYSCFPFQDTIILWSLPEANSSISWKGIKGTLGNSSNPSVVPSKFPSYYEITAKNLLSGCILKDTSIVFSGPTANAGPDQVVCPGALVQLGAPDNSNGSWIYDWFPAQAPWQEGTSESDAQPIVLAATNLIFQLTVTDGVSNCEAKSITNIFIDENAEPEKPNNINICRGQTVSLGNDSIPFAIYSWFPVEGLSCTACANPITTTNQSTTYYRTITLPGNCSKSYLDTVQITVKQPQLVLADEIIKCIDIPVKLNPSEIGKCLNCTYQWTPTTGLDNSNIINPTSSSNTDTLYKLVITNPDFETCISQLQVPVNIIDCSSDETTVELVVCPSSLTPINNDSLGYCDNCTYSWSNNVSGINPSFSLSQNTIITLTITKPDNSKSVIHFDIKILKTNFNTIKYRTCEGQPITLSVPSHSPAAAWTWTPAVNLDNANISDPIFTSFNHNFYYLTANQNFIYNQRECNISYKVEVQVNKLPLKEEIQVQSFCENSCKEIGLENNINFRYNWLPVEGVSCISCSKTFVCPDKSTNYWLFVTNPQTGCFSKMEFVVSLADIEPPMVEILDKYELCKDEEIDLIGSIVSQGSYSIEWFPKYGLSNPYVINPKLNTRGLDAGSYKYKLVISDNGTGCLIEKEIDVNIRVNEFDNYVYSCSLEDVGLSIDTFTAISGCDSIVRTITTFKDNFYIHREQVCNSEVAFALDTFKLENNCDSVVLTLYDYIESYYNVIFESSCKRDEVGVFREVFTAVTGCDSIIVRIVNLKINTIQKVQEYVCSPDQVGISFDTIVNTSGCIEILEIHHVLKSSYTKTVNLFTCDLQQAGMFVDSLESIFGCDSIVFKNYTLNQSYFYRVDKVTCDPDKAGVKYDTLVAKNGCDSIINTITQLIPYHEIEIINVSCNPDNVGVEEFSFTSNEGCDSLVTITTYFVPFYQATFEKKTCYADSVGLYFFDFVSNYGCDSFVTLVYTYFGNNTSTTTIYKESCKSEEVGTETLSFPKPNGCDSIVNIITTLSSLPFVSLTKYTCDENNVGAVYDTIKTQNSCDSIIITNTVFKEFYTTFIENQTCNPFLSGIFTDTLKSLSGCDSIVIIETILVEFYTVEIKVPTCNQSQIGIEIDSLISTYGCDSIVVKETYFSENESPIIDSLYLSSEGICVGQEFSIIAKSKSNNIAYEWKNPKGLVVSTASTLSIESANQEEHQGVYTLLVRDTITNCESSVMAIFVNILQSNFENVIAINTGPICEGESVQLLASHVRGAEYLWYKENALNGDIEEIGNGRSIVVNNLSVSDSGDYKVKISAADCGLIILSTKVKVFPKPFVVIVSDTIVNKGEQLLLDASLSSNNIISYNWEPKNLFKPGANNQPLVITNPINLPNEVNQTYFTLRVFDMNLCNHKDSVLVKFLNSENSYQIPNLITPNGDGVNDYFVIPFIHEIGNYTMKIFGRGGAELYSTTSYDNKWDATHNGAPLPDGPYWYLIRAIDGKEFKGAVSVIRN